MDRYQQAHKIASPAVSLSADGGQHGLQCFDADGILFCGWPDEHEACEICGHSRKCHNPFIHYPEGCHAEGCQCLEFSGYVPVGPNGWHWGSCCPLSPTYPVVAEADDLRS